MIFQYIKNLKPQKPLTKHQYFNRGIWKKEHTSQSHFNPDLRCNSIVSRYTQRIKQLPTPSNLSPICYTNSLTKRKIFFLILKVLSTSAQVQLTHITGHKVMSFNFVIFWIIFVKDIKLNDPPLPQIELYSLFLHKNPSWLSTQVA